MPNALRPWLIALPIISIVLLAFDAPGPVIREAYFVALLLGFTMATRTVTWTAAVAALSLGIGVAAPAMIGIGWLLNLAGVDLTSGAGSWLIVPIIEEFVKLAPVAIVAVLHRRRTGLTLNPSDFLLLGVAAGAGFAMVENAQLIQNNPGAAYDMADRFGPTWLVPGAWGAAGYVGHAAATGLAAGGIGLARAFRRSGASGPAANKRAFALIALVAPFAWVALEHVLANLHVNTGSDATFVLGNGRLTPWIFLAVLGLIVYRDLASARRVLRESQTLRIALRLAREAVIGTRLPKRKPIWTRAAAAAGQIRIINATAWWSLT